MIMESGGLAGVSGTENVPLTRENGDYDVIIRASQRGHLVSESMP